MTEKKKIYISSHEHVKSGTKNGRDWSMYRITDPQNNRYTIFDAKYSGMIGQEVEVYVKTEKVEKDGKTYTNRTIVNPPKTYDVVSRHEHEALERRVLALEQAIAERVQEETAPPLEDLPSTPF